MISTKKHDDINGNRLLAALPQNGQQSCWNSLKTTTYHLHARRFDDSGRCGIGSGIRANAIEALKKNTIIFSTE